MKPIPFNEKLIWDYDIPADAQTNEGFRLWYIGRVLSHGTAQDIRAVGLGLIHTHFPRLMLPREIRDFWQWYFSLPQVRMQYGDIDTIPETFVDRNRPIPT